MLLRDTANERTESHRRILIDHRAATGEPCFDHTTRFTVYCCVFSQTTQQDINGDTHTRSHYSSKHGWTHGLVFGI